MASVHAGQRGSRDELTKRTVEAMYHPSVSAISHPTGRLIDRRAPNALDLDTAFAVALETGTALETNGLPDRLDLKDEHVRQAVEAGIPIVVSTDAHSTRGPREHRARARDGPPRLGDRRGRRQHAPAGGDPGVEEARATAR